MSGLDQILATIRENAEDKIRMIEEEASEQITAAEKKAKAEADRVKTEAADAAEAQCKRDIENAASSAKTVVNRAVLEAKVAAIRETVEEALSAIRSLPDAEYAAVLCRKIAAAAENHGGTVFLSAADQARVPADFAEQIAAALPAGVTVTVSEEAAPVRDGFLLRYGDIEENGSWDALAEAKSEALKDAVAAVLFR